MHKFLAAFALLLAACGTTTYEILPPPTEEGKACANQCLQILTTCENQCETNSRLCETMNFTTRSVINRPLFDDDCSPSMCNERCAIRYRQCHLNCGGIVIEHRPGS